jgi:hypothetical protein
MGLQVFVLMPSEMLPSKVQNMLFSESIRSLRMIVIAAFVHLVVVLRVERVQLEL